MVTQRWMFVRRKQSRQLRRIGEGVCNTDEVSCFPNKAKDVQSRECNGSTSLPGSCVKSFIMDNIVVKYKMFESLYWKYILCIRNVSQRGLAFARLWNAELFAMSLYINNALYIQSLYGVEPLSLPLARRIHPLPQAGYTVRSGPCDSSPRHGFGCM